MFTTRTSTEKEEQISEIFTKLAGEPEYYQRRSESVVSADEAVSDKLMQLGGKGLYSEVEDLITTSCSEYERDGFIQGFLYAASLSRLLL